MGLKINHKKRAGGGGLARRIKTFLMCAVLVLSQTVGLFAPAVAQAAESGTMDIRAVRALPYGPFQLTHIFQSRGGYYLQCADAQLPSSVFVGQGYKTHNWTYDYGAFFHDPNNNNEVNQNLLRAIMYWGPIGPDYNESWGSDGGLFPSTSLVSVGTNLSQWDRDFMLMHILLTDMRNGNGQVACQGLTESQIAAVKRYVIGFDHAATYDGEKGGWATSQHTSGGPYADSTRAKLMKYSNPGNDRWLPSEDEFKVFFATNPGSPNSHQMLIGFEHNPKVTVTFNKVSAKVEVTKDNDEYSVDGAEYDIYDADTGKKVDHIVLENGRATYQLKKDADYYAVETKAPKGFKLNTKHINFDTRKKDPSVDLPDDPGRLYLHVQKKDSATLGEAQPGATFAGAEYEITYQYDGSTATKKATTNENGNLSFRDIPFGDVSVRETKAPTGYKLDPTVHSYHVSENPDKNVVDVEMTPEDDFKENVIAFNLKLVKYLDNGQEGSGLQNPGEGIQFQLISNTTNEVVATMTTDKDGYAALDSGWYGKGTRVDGINGCIPYDKAGYTVREVAKTVPSGFAKCDDWQITPDQQVDGVTLSYIVDNDRVESHIQVVKTDSVSGQTVPLPGFTFQILDEDEKVISMETWVPNHATVDTFTTDESGMVTLPEALQPGTYTVRETAAVSPYLKGSRDATVTIMDSPEIPPVTVVKYADEQAKGKAAITKTDAETGEALAGATFHVVAVGDVVSPDGRVEATDGQLMTMVTTDENGRAETGLLPLGTGSATYAFIEQSAPDGHVLDQTPHEVTLTYKDDTTPVVTAETTAENTPNRLILAKVSATSGKKLSGATFGLWPKDAGDTADEGTSPVRVVAPDNDDHDVRLVPSTPQAEVEAGDVADGVTVSLTNADGEKVVELAGDPVIITPGSYTVALEHEGEAVEASGETEVDIEADKLYSFNVADVMGAWEVGSAVSDIDTSVALSRKEGTDATWETPDVYGSYVLTVDGEPYDVAGEPSGAVAAHEGGCTLFLGVVDGKAARVERLLTDKSDVRFSTGGADGKVVFDRLGTNKKAVPFEYAEVKAPAGYAIDRTVRPVTAAEDGRIEGEGEYKVDTPNEPTKVDVSKVEVAGGPEIPGAKLTVTDSEGNVVDEWVSTDEPHRIEALVPGTYTLTEVMTPRTYDQAEPIEFTVAETGEVTPVEMIDEPIKITGELDKRQQIADPVADDVVANGDDANKADVTESEDGVYTYTLDHRSTSNTWTDEYTVEDPLEAVAAGLAELQSIRTGVAGKDYDGKVNVWYKTNTTPEDYVDESGANQTLSDGHENPWLADEANAERLGEDGRRLDYTGWRLWKADVPCCIDTELRVSDLKLGEGEHVTGIRMEYGRVEAGFTSRPDEASWTRDDLKDGHDDITQIAAGDVFECPFEGHEGHGEGSESHYGPIQVTMKVNKGYVPETDLENSANVFLARNGGDDENLEDKDEDKVVQTPKTDEIDISGRLDKRQQIADPVADGVVENGDGENRAEVTVSDSGEFDYTLDFENTSTTWVDEFTVTDELTCVTDNLATLKSVTTPQAFQDYDGLMNVWYATNQTERDYTDPSGANQTIDDGHENEGAERQLNYTGWHLWKQNIPATMADTLEVSDLKLADGEKVVAVRFEYGRVEKGFTTRPNDSALWSSDSLKAAHDDFAGDAQSQGSFTDADGQTRQFMPAVLTCEVTEDYVPGKDLKNEADLYLARLAYGELLEDEDEDEVVQTPRDQGKPVEVAKAEKAINSMVQTGTGLLVALSAAACSGLACWALSRKLFLEQ